MTTDPRLSNQYGKNMEFSKKFLLLLIIAETNSSEISENKKSYDEEFGF